VTLRKFRQPSISSFLRSEKKTLGEVLQTSKGHVNWGGRRGENQGGKGVLKEPAFSPFNFVDKNKMGVTGDETFWAREEKTGPGNTRETRETWEATGNVNAKKRGGI